MLTPEQLESIGNDALKIYEGLEIEIIEEIASRIANVGYANTVVKNDVIIAQEMGMLYQDVINSVAKYNNDSYKYIYDIFQKASIKSINKDDLIYKEAGLNPLPIKQSKSMQQLLNVTIEKTKGNLNNLTLTTANNAQNQFYNVMNNSYMEVLSGVKSYSQSIIDAIDILSERGAFVTYPSGYRTSLENACRMNILTSVNQTNGKLQELRAKEMGWDLMEITAHSGARPSHAEWQGKIVSLSGKKGYLSLNDIGYATVTGFKGVNCRHDWMPFYEGSTRTYTNKELNELKNETVTYNGKKINKYDATQIQRGMERQIRNDKKKIAGINNLILNGNYDDKDIIDMKTKFAKQILSYNTHKNQLNDFVEQINLKNNIWRTYIGKEGSSFKNQQSAVTKIANKYNSNLIGSSVNGINISEISEHIISRTYARDISFEDVTDTLKNPIKYDKIRKDNSQQIKGKNCTIVINVKTGKLITAFPKKTKKEG